MMVGRLSALRTDRHYPQEIFLVLISVRDGVDRRGIMRPVGFFNEKYQIETSTFQLLTLCLNQLAYHVPPIVPYSFVKLCTFRENYININP